MPVIFPRGTRHSPRTFSRGQFPLRTFSTPVSADTGHFPLLSVFFTEVLFKLSRPTYDDDCHKIGRKRITGVRLFRFRLSAVHTDKLRTGNVITRMSAETGEVNVRRGILSAEGGVSGRGVGYVQGNVLHILHPNILCRKPKGCKKVNLYTTQAWLVV